MTFRPYWAFRDEIHEIGGLVVIRERLFVPSVLRKEMLDKIYESHLGMDNCKARAREVLYWPGMSQGIEKP